MCSTNDGFELATPVLLVDGYNLCGYWPKLKKHFSKGHLDTARQKLIDEMINFSAIRGTYHSIGVLLRLRMNWSTGRALWRGIRGLFIFTLTESSGFIMF